MTYSHNYTEESDAVAVTGLGMVSSIGLDVVTSCASARAGISRADELENFKVVSEGFDEHDPIISHSVPILTQGFAGSGRMISLCVSALSDLSKNVDLSQFDWERTGFFLNMPSGYYFDVEEIINQTDNSLTDIQQVTQSDITKERDKSLAADVISTVLQIMGMPIPVEHHRLYLDDNTGVIKAISDASVLLQGGVLDRCFIGGVDSLIETDILEVLDSLDLLKTPGKTHGVFPGEAAAFVLLERCSNATQSNSNVECILQANAVTKDFAHRFYETATSGVPLAEVLTATLQNCSHAGKDAPFIIADQNGDAWKAKEWANASIRVSAQFPDIEQPLWNTAQFFGETGAASGAIAICMGARAFARDYAPSNNFIVCMSSYNGSKAALHAVR
ncbi:MAG: hypothetical protein QNL05_03045, partial [Gammaproteobacteria bacterium]|nr:hypothetical protein [Gammaproteobacteria bacterium]